MKKTMVVGLVLIVLGIIFSGIGFANGGMKTITEKNGTMYVKSFDNQFGIHYEFGKD